MKLDAMIGGVGLREAAAFARDAEAAGFAGLWFTEGGRTAYLGSTAAVLSTERLEIGTGIAVAFPRSPFVTAATAWELADASAGRFILGLGTQVKAHVERRYAAPFAPPGPRLAEYVGAVRAVWHSFQSGEPLRFDGEYYPMSIGPLGAWTGGPIEHSDIPIYVAGVRTWMLRMIGEVADGIHIHPLHSVRYLDDVIAPNLAAGAQRAGRDPSDVVRVCPVLTITGDTDAQRALWRERARAQLAFYGSTRTYARVFEIEGLTGVSEALHELQRAGDYAGMAKILDDGMLAKYTVEGAWDELASVLHDRYEGRADRLIVYFSGVAWREDRDVMARWRDVASTLHSTR